jgi:hypothetical protein
MGGGSAIGHPMAGKKNGKGFWPSGLAEPLLWAMQVV